MPFDGVISHAPDQVSVLQNIMDICRAYQQIPMEQLES